MHAHVYQEGQGTLENCIWKKGFESGKLSEQKVENRQHIVNGACIHKPCFALINKSSVREQHYPKVLQDEIGRFAAEKTPQLIP